MPVFVLHVPTDKLAWAKKEALAHGGELHADALSGSVVLMAPSLPASLETFVPGAAPKATRTVRASEPIRSFVLDVPFALRAVAQSLGARWDKDAKALVYQGARLPAGLVPFAALPWSAERSLASAAKSAPPLSSSSVFSAWAREAPSVPAIKMWRTCTCSGALKRSGLAL